MLANYLVGLREGLEASLVVVVLVAHLVRTGRRGLLAPLWTGVAVAVLVSLGFGALLTFGPRGLTFQAQEVIGGGLSIVAVGFVTWMVLWMASAARGLSGELKSKADAAATAGRASVVVLAMLAVGREGLETALFLWAATRAAAGAEQSDAVPLLAALLGILTAVAIGWAIYRGALRLDLGRFFAWTGAFLVLVAAGVLSYGVHDLQEAGVLPGLNALAFDVSGVIDPTTVAAALLKGIFNFSPATTWWEAAAWLAYVAVVLPLFVRRLRAGRPSGAPDPSTSPSTSPSTQTGVSA